MDFLCLRRQYGELLAPKGRLQFYDVGEVPRLRHAFGQVKTRIDATPGELDDLAVEGGSALAGSVEGPFARRQGCIKSIPRAVISLAGLCYGLFGECANALGHGGIETGPGELVCLAGVG